MFIGCGGVFWEGMIVWFWLELEDGSNGEIWFLRCENASRGMLKVHTSTINRNENMVWTDSQDYGADEILCITWIMLFDKINRLIREIIILSEVYPQLFLAISSLRWRARMESRVFRQCQKISHEIYSCWPCWLRSRPPRAQVKCSAGVGGDGDRIGVVYSYGVRGSRLRARRIGWMPWWLDCRQWALGV